MFRISESYDFEVWRVAKFAENLMFFELFLGLVWDCFFFVFVSILGGFLE